MSCKRLATKDEIARRLKRLMRPGELKKEFDPRIARELGFPESRVRNLRQGRARRIEQYEAEATARREGQGNAARGQSLATEIAALKARIARLEARLRIF